MSEPKSFTGEYKLDVASAEAEFTIPTITVTENSESIELSPSGIKTQSASYDRLLSTHLAAVLSARCASHWRALKFDRVAELEDGKEVSQGLVVDALMSPSRVDEQEYREALSILLALDYASLLFLMRASEILKSDMELSILNALFALESELDRIVPQPLNMAPKLSFLDFAGVISPEALERLRSLGKLRNVLAHGDWNQENLGKSLARLLGGKPEDWLQQDTAWISGEAAREVLCNIIAGLGDLLQCEETLRQLRAGLAKLKQPQIDSSASKLGSHKNRIRIARATDQTVGNTPNHQT